MVRDSAGGFFDDSVVICRRSRQITTLPHFAWPPVGRPVFKIKGSQDCLLESLMIGYIPLRSVADLFRQHAKIKELIETIIVRNCDLLEMGLEMNCLVF